MHCDFIFIAARMRIWLKQITLKMNVHLFYFFSGKSKVTINSVNQWFRCFYWISKARLQTIGKWKWCWQVSFSLGNVQIVGQAEHNAPFRTRRSSVNTNNFDFYIGFQSMLFLFGNEIFHIFGMEIQKKWKKNNNNHTKPYQKNFHNTTNAS